MLKEEFIKFSDYDFIRLYCAIYVKNSGSPILIHHQLEKELSIFYDNPKYKTIFQEINFKRDYINEENSYFDLENALQIAQIMGLLILIEDSGKNRSLITCKVSETEKIISEYDEKIVELMISLVEHLSNNEKNNQGKNTKKLIKTTSTKNI